MEQKEDFGEFCGVRIFLGVACGKAVAQIPVERPVSEENVQFRPVEQPLGLKVAVTLGGMGLIGLELWWFLFSKPKAVQAQKNQDV